MYKFFKISITFVVIAAAMIATQAFAGVMTQTPISVPVQEPEYFNGLYLGIGGGLVKSDAEVIHDYSATIEIPSDDSIEMSKNLKLDDSGEYGFGGNIFVGFGKVFDSNKYLGAELFGNLYNVDTNVKDSTTLPIRENPTASVYNIDVIFKNKIKNDYSYGILVRGGYLISSKTMFYILFGVEQSKFKVENSVVFNGWDDFKIISGIDDALTTIDKFNKTKTGFLPGIGIETAFNEQVALRLQYTHTFYSSFKHIIQDTSIVGSTPDLATITKTYNTKVNPNRGLVSLILSWYIV